jgi:hypothetical protein
MFFIYFSDSNEHESASKEMAEDAKNAAKLDDSKQLDPGVRIVL